MITIFMHYYPSPIDTSKINIPKQLNPLIESLAKNIHEVWAKQRIKEGWTYGPKRNDDKKHHPDLIPYEQLGETEKDYDRNYARETIKLIISLGFDLQKK
jgi:hypothetical protein